MFNLVLTNVAQKSMQLFNLSTLQDFKGLFFMFNASYLYLNTTNMLFASNMGVHFHASIDKLLNENFVFTTYMHKKNLITKFL